MKHLLIILLIFTLGFSLANAKTQVPANKLSITNSSLTQKQADLIYNKTKDFPENTQLSFAFIKDGELEYFGIKHSDGEIVNSHNHENVFEIGSITKVFTSTILANLIKDKKLKLDDEINAYIKTPLNNDAKITFKELASHHSGLERMPSNFSSLDLYNPYKSYDSVLLEEYLKNNLKLNKKKYSYSNLGAGLLGYILGKIDNKSYQELLHTYVSSKFGMKNTTTIRNEIDNLLIKGLDFKGNEVPNWDFNSLVAAGGILSNVEDLAKFAFAQFNESNTELTLTRNKTFEINKNMDIGLGWHLVKKDDKVYYWHNGGTGGYTSSMSIDPISKNAVIILSNISAFNKNMSEIDKINFALMKLL